jgi:hypothetical protein
MGMAFSLFTEPAHEVNANHHFMISWCAKSVQIFVDGTA